ncbi:hypothetical protein [Frigidibacter sp. MR17.24]
MRVDERAGEEAEVVTDDCCPMIFCAMVLTLVVTLAAGTAMLLA